MFEDKKEIIREAAIRTMAQKGFYNTKTSQIAKEASVAVGTIYNYFDSKEDILEYIFAVELKKRYRYLKELNEKDLDFIEKIESFLIRHFKEITNNPDIGRILVREKDFPRAKNHDYIAEYLNKLPEMIKVMLDKAIFNAEIRRYNTEIISAFIFGAIQGIVEKAIYTNDINILNNASSEIINLLKNGL
jgi:TetR/AcrR family transcriptional regulator, fatty acid metabolism regulator protein